MIYAENFPIYTPEMFSNFVEEMRRKLATESAERLPFVKKEKIKRFVKILTFSGFKGVVFVLDRPSMESMVKFSDDFKVIANEMRLRQMPLYIVTVTDKNRTKAKRQIQEFLAANGITVKRIFAVLPE